MSDIFREVEEDVRRERLEQLWKRYGTYILALVVLLVLGVAGYTYWQKYQANQSIKASSQFLQAMELAAGTDPAKAAAEYAALAKKAPSGYARLSQLAEANSLQAAGKPKAALALYQRIITKGDDAIADTARIRIAWMQADTAKKADIAKDLAPLNKADSAWHYMAQEILAYVDYRDGNLDAARKGFESLSKGKDVPGAIQDRASAMAALLTTGVGNYGKLPEPKDSDKADAKASAKAAPAVQTKKGNK